MRNVILSLLAVVLGVGAGSLASWVAHRRERKDAGASRVVAARGAVVERGGSEVRAVGVQSAPVSIVDELRLEGVIEYGRRYHALLSNGTEAMAVEVGQDYVKLADGEIIRFRNKAERRQMAIARMEYDRLFPVPSPLPSAASVPGVAAPVAVAEGPSAQPVPAARTAEEIQGLPANGSAKRNPEPEAKISPSDDGQISVDGVQRRLSGSASSTTRASVGVGQRATQRSTAIRH